MPRVLPHVSLLTEQRRNRNEPWVPSPTSPRSEQGEASQCKRGNLIVVTSEVWALAQDSNQPELTKIKALMSAILDLRPNLWGNSEEGNRALPTRPIVSPRQESA